MVVNIKMKLKFISSRKNAARWRYFHRCWSLFQQTKCRICIGTRRNFENCSSSKFDSKTFSETIISIDTFRSEVAKASIESGAAIINDISAGNLDDKMFEIIAKYNVPYIMMHMRGNPQTMQTLTNYEDIVKKCCFIFRKSGYGKKFWN
jgi:hypothetical protein